MPYLLAVSHQDLAGRRKSNTAGIPAEQCCSELLLQAFDPCRYVGLHREHGFRCYGETLMLGNRFKYLQIIRIHSLKSLKVIYNIIINRF